MKSKTTFTFTQDDVLKLLAKELRATGMSEVNMSKFRLFLTEGRDEDRGGDAVAARIDSIEYEH